MEKGHGQQKAHTTGIQTLLHSRYYMPLSHLL